jgi:hypothetical protein
MMVALIFTAVRASELPTDLLQTFCSRKVHKCICAVLCTVFIELHLGLECLRHLEQCHCSWLRAATESSALYVVHC